MSDFHAGFYITRTDSMVHPAAFEAVRGYLQSCGFELPSFAMAWFGRQGVPFYLLVIANDGLFAGREIETWVMNHENKLGPALATALECDVWSYTYNNQVGYDSASLWTDGATEPDLTFTGEWERGPRALRNLSEKLGVSKNLLEHDLIYGTPSASARLDDHCDTELLTVYEKQLLPTPRDEGEDATKQLLYVTANILREMVAVIERRDCSLSDLLHDAWEMSKFELKKIPTDGYFEGEVRLTARKLKLPTSSISDLPPLDESGNKVGHTFYFDEQTLRELQNLAMSQDRSVSWMLRQAYLTARDRLYV